MKNWELVNGIWFGHVFDKDYADQANLEIGEGIEGPTLTINAENVELNMYGVKQLHQMLASVIRQYDK